MSSLTQTMLSYKYQDEFLFFITILFILSKTHFIEMYQYR